jgi:Phage portal protein
MVQYGMAPRARPAQPVYKPTPRNLRYFGKTSYARRAINTVKNSIAQLDWELVVGPGYEASDETKRQMDVVHYCLEHPNEDDSFSTLVEQVVEDMMMGAGAIEQSVGGDPLRPLWLWPCDGLSIQIYPFWDGSPSMPRYVQTLGYGNYTGMTPVAQLLNSELIYIKPNPTTSDPFGLGPMEVAFQAISSLLGVTDYAQNTSSNRNPVGGLWMGDVGNDEVRQYREYWKNDIEGQGRMPIWGGGEKKPEFVPLHPEGDNALYLKYQEMLQREIATAFDISPQNLGVERDINRNTAEVAEDRDVAQAIGPWGRKFAMTLTREAIHGLLGFSTIEFRFKGLDRTDEMEAAQVYHLEYESNAQTPNLYRASRGLPPLQSKWADMVWADVQIAMEAARGAKLLPDEDVQQYDVPQPEDQLISDQNKGKTGGDSVPGKNVDSSMPTRTPPPRSKSSSPTKRRYRSPPDGSGK